MATMTICHCALDVCRLAPLPRTKLAAKPTDPSRCLMLAMLLVANCYAIQAAVI